MMGCAISQCDTGMGLRTFDRDDAATATIERVWKSGAKHLVHLPPRSQRLRERVLEYDIAVLVQRDARQYIDTYRRIEWDTRCSHRLEQFRVCNDPCATSSEFVRNTFEDFYIPTFA
ncbi:hypothetical protein EMIT0P291_120055 [Pseudomonas sp. IT-P291]